MLQMVKQHQNYLGGLRAVVEQSPDNSRYLCEALGMDEAAFCRKLDSGAFSVPEVEKLTEMLYPEEALVMEIEEAEREIAEGKTFRYEDVREELRKKFL